MSKASRTSNTAEDIQGWLPTPDQTPDDPRQEGTTLQEGTVYSPGGAGDVAEPPEADAGGTEKAVLVDPGRRFVAFVLETVLFIGTFGIGWLVWSVIEWRDARTPAKRLLRDLTVVDAWTGENVSWRRMAVRELGAKIGLVGLFGMATFGLGWAIAAALVMSETRAALWDRLAGTAVVHPDG